MRDCKRTKSKAKEKKENSTETDIYSIGEADSWQVSIIRHSSEKPHAFTEAVIRSSTLTVGPCHTDNIVQPDHHDHIIKSA